jgi:hypothetical protein
VRLKLGRIVFDRSMAALRYYSRKLSGWQLLGVSAFVGQLGLAVYWNTILNPSPRIPRWQLYVFLGAVAYGVGQPWITRLLVPKRLKRERSMRPQRLAQAIARISVHLGREYIPENVLRDVERGALDNIKSEIEALSADDAGTDITASLLVPDPGDDSRLICINRSESARKFPKTYPKAGMVAWACMQEGLRKYSPSFSGTADQPYHCILALPLYVADETGEKRVLGAVSIDHPQREAFWGLEEEVEVAVTSNLRILELALMSRAERPQPPPEPPHRPKRRNRP